MDDFLYSIGIENMPNRNKLYLLNEIYSKYIYYLKSGVYFNGRRLKFSEYLELLKEKEDIETYKIFSLRNRHIIINMVKNLDIKTIVGFVRERNNIFRKEMSK